MKLTLIRHGETEEPGPGLSEIGHADPDLSSRGSVEAEAIARALRARADKGERFEGLYSSPLRAARSTASLIGQSIGLEITRLHDELATLTPEVVPPGGALEALGLLQERAWDLVEALRQKHDDASTLLLVSHNLTIRTLVCRMLDASLVDLHRFELAPASITTLEFRNQRRLLSVLNETCHLQGSMPLRR